VLIKKLKSLASILCLLSIHLLLNYSSIVGGGVGAGARSSGGGSLAQICYFLPSSS